MSGLITQTRLTCVFEKDTSSPPTLEWMHPILPFHAFHTQEARTPAVSAARNPDALIMGANAIHTCVTDVTEVPAGLVSTRDLIPRESDDVMLQQLSQL